MHPTFRVDPPLPPTNGRIAKSVPHTPAARTEHDAEAKPAVEPRNYRRRRAVRWERSDRQKRNREHGEKCGLQQLTLPPEAVPVREHDTIATSDVFNGERMLVFARAATLLEYPVLS